MPVLLYSIIGYAISSVIIKLFVGLGIGITAYVGLSNLIETALDYIVVAFNALPVGVVSIVSIAGVPEAMSVIGSAVLTRAAYESAKAFVAVA